MSERQGNEPVTPAWSVDFGSRYPDVLRGLDNNLLRGPASGASGIGPSSGRGSDRGTGTGGWGFFSSGSVPPKWYRWLAITASAGSGITILLIYLAAR